MTIDLLRKYIRGLVAIFVVLPLWLAFDSCSRQKDTKDIPLKDKNVSKRQTARTSAEEHLSIPIQEGTRVKKRDLRQLPNIINPHNREVNNDILLELGIPPKKISELSLILKQSYDEAWNFRIEETKSLHFKLNENVVIKPLSLDKVDGILNRLQKHADAIQDGVTMASPSVIKDAILLLKMQIEKDFSSELSVMLARSEFLSSMHIAHTPPEYRGMVFKVEQRNSDGTINKFTLDPIQPKSSKYCFISLEKK